MPHPKHKPSMLFGAETRKVVLKTQSGRNTIMHEDDVTKVRGLNDRSSVCTQIEELRTIPAAALKGDADEFICSSSQNWMFKVQFCLLIETFQWIDKNWLHLD